MYVCGNNFMAEHKTKKFCSDECLKIQITRNKDNFNKNNKDVEYAKPYNTSYIFWYNRVNKLRKSLANNEEKLQKLEVKFKEFKKQSNEYKVRLKSGKADVKSFLQFLKKQELWIDEFYYLNKK